MSNIEKELVQNRLVFYENDIEKINKVLQAFITLSEAKCAMLIDKEGHMVTNAGQEAQFDTDTISALAAGSFAATKEMAKVLGEDEFSVLFHQGKVDNIQLTLIGDRCLLAVVFDERTTIGMVRLYAKEAATRLMEIFKVVEKREPSADEKLLKDGFSNDAGNKMDDLFGEDA